MKLLEQILPLIEQVIEEESNTNTLASDVNEILTGYYAVDKDWKKFANGKEAAAFLRVRKNSLPPELFKDQAGRAKVMANSVKDWAKQNGYDSEISKAWWTARPGVLGRAVGKEIDSRNNPTDILLQFADETFLGISAKSTARTGDIGFKNPGLGSISRALGIDFVRIAERVRKLTVKKLKLPDSLAAAKAYIRSHPKVQKITIAVGQRTLSLLRAAVMKRFQEMSQDDLRKYIVSDWLNAGDVYPYYVKATGFGTNGRYSARVFDPIKNDKLQKLSNGVVSFVPIGNETIGVLADGARMLKIRFKYDSEKLASSIKASGDPWK